MLYDVLQPVPDVTMVMLSRNGCLFRIFLSSYDLVSWVQ